MYTVVTNDCFRNANKNQKQIRATFRRAQSSAEGTETAVLYPQSTPTHSHRLRLQCPDHFQPEHGCRCQTRGGKPRQASTLRRTPSSSMRSVDVWIPSFPSHRITHDLHPPPAVDVRRHNNTDIHSLSWLISNTPQKQNTQSTKIPATPPTSNENNNKLPACRRFVIGQYVGHATC